ncbi:MAG TPA: hypothetical protein ENJ56_02740, partial [Anaerolineae bacterium]|nr:hypothetical protein [Anaerolineae bacterium]
MQKLRLIELAGSYYQIGRKHGEQYGDDIRLFAKERVELCMSGQWSDQPLTRQRVLEIAEACVPFHTNYAPDLMDELRGMADATGLSLAELIIVNGFTDFIDTLYAVTKQDRPIIDNGSNDDCTAFLVPNAVSADQHGFYGQTWDMHDSATPYVLLLRVKPDNAPSALVFTITGCVGMIGMNSEGIAVGINNLMGGDGCIGVTWPFVVRKVLQQDNIADALACIMEAPLAGAHNFMLMDKLGNGYNIEAFSTTNEVTKLGANPIAHTNHCLFPHTIACSRPRDPATQARSEHRLTSAEKLMQGVVSAETLLALTNSSDVVAISSE